jgi:hypothetical protein
MDFPISIQEIVDQHREFAGYPRSVLWRILNEACRLQREADLGNLDMHGLIEKPPLVVPGVPYPEFCRHYDKCAGLSCCPRDPCCCD